MLVRQCDVEVRMGPRLSPKQSVDGPAPVHIHFQVVFFQENDQSHDFARVHGLSLSESASSFGLRTDCGRITSKPEVNQEERAISPVGGSIVFLNASRRVISEKPVYGQLRDWRRATVHLKQNAEFATHRGNSTATDC